MLQWGIYRDSLHTFLTYITDDSQLSEHLQYFKPDPNVLCSEIENCPYRKLSAMRISEENWCIQSGYESSHLTSQLSPLTCSLLHLTSLLHLAPHTSCLTLLQFTRHLSPFSDSSPRLTDKFLGVQPDLHPVVEEGEQGSQREGRHEDGDEAKLEDWGKGKVRLVTRDSGLAGLTHLEILLEESLILHQLVVLLSLAAADTAQARLQLPT